MTTANRPNPSAASNLALPLLYPRLHRLPYTGTQITYVTHIPAPAPARLCPPPLLLASSIIDDQFESITNWAATSNTHRLPPRPPNVSQSPPPSPRSPTCRTEPRNKPTTDLHSCILRDLAPQHFKFQHPLPPVVHFPPFPTHSRTRSLSRASASISESLRTTSTGASHSPHRDARTYARTSHSLPVSASQLPQGAQRGCISCIWCIMDGWTVHRGGACRDGEGSSSTCPFSTPSPSPSLSASARVTCITRTPTRIRRLPCPATSSTSIINHQSSIINRPSSIVTSH